MANSPIKPDPKMTPGETLTADTVLICSPGYAKSVRDVPSSEKRMVYHLYGIDNRDPGEFEVDHLVSLELGGSNSIRNLWPQSFLTHPLNAHVKDVLENKLHDLVCSGRVSIHDAQKDIATDWVSAYEKYVGPLPRAVDVSQEKSVQEHSVSSEEVHPFITGNCPEEAPIKVSKKGVYHLKSDPNYSSTHAIHCFSSIEAAESSGFRAPKGQ